MKNEKAIKEINGRKLKINQIYRIFLKIKCRCCNYSFYEFLIVIVVVIIVEGKNEDAVKEL